MFDFIDIKTAWMIVHLFGVALGAGGAYMSDAMFFSSVRDGKFTKREVEFLQMASLMIWFGIVVLLISGAGLFTLDPDKYMSSTKFLAKISIVTVIVFNGAIFHMWHIPRLVGSEGHKFRQSKRFMKKAPFLLLSGAISIVSWSFALVLGALHGVPYSYNTIMTVYFSILALAVIVTWIGRNHFLPTGKVEY